MANENKTNVSQPLSFNISKDSTGTKPISPVAEESEEVVATPEKQEIAITKEQTNQPGTVITNTKDLGNGSVAVTTENNKKFYHDNMLTFDQWMNAHGLEIQDVKDNTDIESQLRGYMDAYKKYAAKPKDPKEETDRINREKKWSVLGEILGKTVGLISDVSSASQGGIVPRRESKLNTEPYDARIKAEEKDYKDRLAVYDKNMTDEMTKYRKMFEDRNKEAMANNRDIRKGYMTYTNQKTGEGSGDIRIAGARATRVGGGGASSLGDKVDTAFYKSQNGDYYQIDFGVGKKDSYMIMQELTGLKFKDTDGTTKQMLDVGVDITDENGHTETRTLRQILSQIGNADITSQNTSMKIRQYVARILNGEGGVAAADAAFNMLYRWSGSDRVPFEIYKFTPRELPGEQGK